MVITSDTALPAGADPTNAQTGATSQTGGVNPATSSFTAALQQKLLSSSDMISSSNTGLESSINSIINNYSQAGQAGDTKINSQYDTQIGNQQIANQNAITAARERGVGLNTSDVAYQALAKQADDQIKALQLQKTEALAANDQQTYSQIAALQVQTLQMKQQAMQQTFSNLLAMSNLNIAQNQDNRAQTAQDFTQSSTISQIALKYGIPVTSGETLASITAKAAPYASQEEKASLALTLANAQKAQAEAQKAIQDGKVSSNLSDPAVNAAFVGLALNQPDVFNALLLKNPQLVSVRNDAVKQQGVAIDEKVQQLVQQGASYQSVRDSISSDNSLGANIDPHANDKIILAAFDKYSQQRTAAGDTARSTYIPPTGVIPFGYANASQQLGGSK